jgi:hypothetical protein
MGRSNINALDADIFDVSINETRRQTVMAHISRAALLENHLT